jgi:hypothetical protein
MVFTHSAVSRPKGGSSSGAGVFCFGVEKSNAYKAPGAVIEGVPATWVSPKIGPLSALSVMASRHAACDNGSARAPKYTSSGVA